MAGILMFFRIIIGLAAVLTFRAASTTKEKTPDFFRFFPNTSFSSWKFACTEQESKCIVENKLLFDGDGQCYPAGERGPCATWEIFHVDKEEADKEEARLRGTCKNLCSGIDYAPLAATGECISRSDVEIKICRSNLYLQPALDVFGQWVCEWTMLLCQPIASLEGEWFYADGFCYQPDNFRISVFSAINKTVPAEKPGDHPLLQYFTNSSVLDKEFPCTEKEKGCFQYGRLLAEDGNCYENNEWSSACENGRVMYLDWEEAIKEGGKLKGSCLLPYFDTNEYQEVEDNRRTYSDMEKICRSEWGMEFGLDFFGRMSCSCSRNPPPSLNEPQSIAETASRPGYCKAPDFHNPVPSPKYDTHLGYGFDGFCSEEEFACLQRGEVLWNGECFALRSRGPCAEDEQLVLDKEALENAQLKPKCTSTSCREGRVLMPLDSKCLTHQQAKSVLCPQKDVALDEFGGWQCSFSPDFPANLSATVRSPYDGSCHIPPNIHVVGGEGFFVPASFAVGGNVGGR